MDVAFHIVAGICVFAIIIAESIARTELKPSSHAIVKWYYTTLLQVVAIKLVDVGTRIQFRNQVLNKFVSADFANAQVRQLTLTLQGALFILAAGFFVAAH